MNTHQYLRPQCVHPQGEIQLPPASPGDPPRPAGRSGLHSCEVTAFALGPSVHETVCALQEWSFCFPQSCGAPAFKPCWPSKAKYSGAPPSDAGPSGWGAWRGANNSSVAELLWYNYLPVFSSLWVNHLGGMGFDYIVSVPLLPSRSGFFFMSLAVEFLFGRFQSSLLMVVQQLVVILVCSWEELNTRSFYSTILFPLTVTSCLLYFFCHILCLFFYIQFWSQESPRSRFLWGSGGFPGGAVVERLPANAGDTDSSPGLGGSHMPQSN